MADLKLIHNGAEETFTGVSKVKLPNPDGVLVVFSEGEAESISVPSFTYDDNGNYVLTPEIGKLYNSVTISKPDTLVPANIKEGVDINGIIGTFAGGKPETNYITSADFSSGDMEILSPAGYALASVTINKPSTLLPENIRNGVNIAGVLGTFVESDGTKTQLFSPKIELSLNWEAFAADITSAVFNIIPASDNGGVETSYEMVGIIPVDSVFNLLLELIISENPDLDDEFESAVAQMTALQKVEVINNEMGLSSEESILDNGVPSIVADVEDTTTTTIPLVNLLEYCMFGRVGVAVRAQAETYRSSPISNVAYLAASQIMLLDMNNQSMINYGEAASASMEGATQGATIILSAEGEPTNLVLIDADSQMYVIPVDFGDGQSLTEVFVYVGHYNPLTNQAVFDGMLEGYTFDTTTSTLKIPIVGNPLVAISKTQLSEEEIQLLTQLS